MTHNVYRNYTNSVSAMKSSLEKLSSGYKINRAGAAAGPAISEKMRAQITGLETAQKNARDGISLVQTAEGALTEVHDMLNRMVELPTQSASGICDNDTDRYQLQKEMDQLREEINRIADNPNFNGIQLLDGSMDGGTKAATSDVPTLQTAATDPTAEVGTRTVLLEPATEVAKTSFSIELHDLTFTPTAASDSLEVTIGDTTLTLDFSGKTAGEELDAAKIAAAIKTAFETAVSISNPDAAAAVPGYEQTGLTVGGTAATAAFTDGDDGSTGNTAAEAELKITLTGMAVDKAGTLKIDVAGNSHEVEVTQDEIDNAVTSSIDKVVAKKLSAMMTDITDATAGDFSVNNFSDGDTVITLKSENQDAAAAAIANTITIAAKAAAAGTPAVPSGMTGTCNVRSNADGKSLALQIGDTADTSIADQDSAGPEQHRQTRVPSGPVK